MGAIDTEDAARRLARVILSDIDLYLRERPNQGGSREAQIEEGRRLFEKRVIPELVPVFAMVLADRAAGRSNARAAAAAAVSSTSASAAAAAVGPVGSPPVTAIEDEPPTDPSILVPPLEDRSAPARAPAARAVVAPAIEDRPKPAPPVAAPSLTDRPPAAPPPAARPVAPAVPPPAPPPAARPVAPALPPPSIAARARSGTPIHVPPAPPAPEP